jgi:transcriptional regulator with GAF, ATPase, and Fis domain
MVVQAGRGTAGVRRVWSHRWFETRLREECTRAAAGGGRFTLVRLSLERPVTWSKVVPIIDRNVPPPHVFAAYGPHDYELLVVGGGEDEAGRIVEAIRSGLSPLDTAVRAGVACYPRHGRTADALMGQANALLRPRQSTVTQDLPGSGGPSAEMQAVYDIARRAARSNISVLILGETGVGKEVMAHAVHRASPRAGKPMLALNCAGLSETLIESELFGHEKGAFTGATQNKKGLFEAAEGGTLFLDEIGEMPPSIQARLLRAIANQEILPVGSTRPRAVDVRILAATNRDLEAEVARGSFREDLYYRLNGITLILPPLRDRKGEITDLARLFVAEATRAAGRVPCTLTPAAVDLLLEYHWPGNIRELKNIIERAVVLCEGEIIDLGQLPIERMRGPATFPPGAPGRTQDPGATLRRKLTTEEEEERRRMVEALEQYTWNQSRAAKAMGMHRRTFVTKLDRYEIPRPTKGR